MGPISRAIAIAGLQEIATACEVTYQAVRKWERARKLPRTEWTGETTYAAKIARATGWRVTEAELRPDVVKVIAKRASRTGVGGRRRKAA